MAESPAEVERALVGCLLGTAAGDSLGLPYEGLSRRRAERMFGPATRQRLIGRAGMVSDDTEHACFVAQALIRGAGDPEQFERLLARSLRWWLLGIPAGIGLATLRSILRLWMGMPPARSGVFSAGNGPAMRAPLLGIWVGNDLVLAEELVGRSTRMTHTDPKALAGALAVAAAASVSCRAEAVTGAAYLELAEAWLAHEPAEETVELLRRAVDSAERGESTVAFAESIGCAQGIGGYVLQTVPCVIQTWLRHAEDFAGGVRELIEAGGDTDTTAAIAGGIIGSRTGREGIPAAWLDGIMEWPRSVDWMVQLAEALAKVRGGEPVACPAYPAVGLAARNAFFVLIVLLHGFRRLAPPW